MKFDAVFYGNTERCYVSTLQLNTTENYTSFMVFGSKWYNIGLYLQLYNFMSQQTINSKNKIYIHIEIKMNCRRHTHFCYRVEVTYYIQIHLFYEIK